MAKAIATIEGTALVPGVSKNSRYYSPEAIAKAVARLSERIADGTNPAVMLTSHDANDDSRRIVGRLASISLTDDGSARFSAQLADTDEGRKIAALVDTRNGPAFLKGVSIRGAWVGKVRREVGTDGRPLETADDLEISGLDFTHKPGVSGAQIDSFTPVASSRPDETELNGRALITESVQEALVTAITEETGAPAPNQPVSEADTPAMSKRSSGLSGAGGIKYADPGYQKDGKQRYDITTKAKAKTAWSYVNQADNARAYTSAQLKRIKGRITKALRGYGVQVATQEGWLIDPATSVSETLAECWDMPSPGGQLYLSLTNGPTTVTVTSSLLDPHDLDLVGRAAMAGACDALRALDPDMDADIDVPGADDEDTDGDSGMAGESAEESATLSPDAAIDWASVPRAVTSDPIRPEYLAALEAYGKPRLAGEYITADRVNEALDALIAAETTPATETSAPAPAAEPATEEEPAMAESITPAADTAASVPAVGGITLTDDQFAQLLARVAPVAAPVEAAPAAAAPVAETTAPAEPTVETVTESEDARIARLVAEGIRVALPAAIQESVERTGPPTRKGLVETTAPAAGAVSTSGLPAEWPQKPLHEYTDEEFRQHVSPATVGAILGARANS